jgi:hypothetical protein
MRIYLEPDDQMIKEINRASEETGIDKAKFVLEAVDHYLHSGDKSELASRKADLDISRHGFNQRWTEITTLIAEITALKAELDKSRSAYDKLMIENKALREDTPARIFRLRRVLFAKYTTYFKHYIISFKFDKSV